MECDWRITTAFYFSLLTSSITFNFLSIEPAQATRIPTNRTETDRLALLAFKAKITNDPFRVLGSWNDSLSFCNWQGVTCSPRHQRVTILDLNSQGLVGTLSPDIGNLTFLKTLYLYNNHFRGEIPLEIGRLYRLLALSLVNNSFVGNIPANISRCTKLQRLHLYSNELEGKIPIELGSLSKLKNLVLHTNNLRGGIPSFLGNLSSLQTIDLTGNSLGGHIPNSLCQLKSLRWFGCGTCMLSGTVPSFLYNISSLTAIVLTTNQQLNGRLPPYIRLPNLETIAIGANHFSGTIPVSLFNASRIQQLDLGSNNFWGKFPVEVGNLRRLRRMSIYSNRFGSGKSDDLDFLTTLTNCSNLNWLDVGDNQFGGMLTFPNLSNQLTKLHVGGNQLHGNIPCGIHNFVNLIALFMNRNFFTGSIPISIGMLPKLQTLNLSGNRLSRELPPSIGNMSSLYILNLSTNMLEGKIILDITRCRSLAQLDLSYNKLDGPIPEKFVDLSSQLLILDLSHNSLIGSLPIQLGSFTHLRILDVSENNMSSEIPSTIGGCSSLQKLTLKGNFFQGPIPTSFKSLKDMRRLDLSGNNLSGIIPKDLGYLPLLENLNLSFNNLDGSVPTEGVFKNGSAFSVLGNKKLCGGIIELQLPACHTQKLEKRKMSLALKVILGVVLSSIGLASFFFVALHWRRPKETSSSEPIPGDHFERVSYHELHRATHGFSLANLIGVGSFGSVYKGLLHEKEGSVAVKVLNLIERGASKSFIAECDALRKIRHRNLLKILTICSSVDFKGNDFKALVFKFMPNGNLETCLHQSSDGGLGVLSLFQRLNIAIDIASALNYVHNHCGTCIIHCDIKPSNILLDEDMTAHVGDFGLAKFLPRSTSNFNASEGSSASPRGTVGYIPPEYGIGGEVSKQGDVYSYGILLLEMFTGKRPTDNIFKDGLTLHHFCSMALPLRVMDIVDPQMPLEEHHDIINSTYQRDRIDKIRECIASIFKVGVACSVESQSDRLGIDDVLMELHVIKEVFLGARRQRQIQHTT